MRRWARSSMSSKSRQICSKKRRLIREQMIEAVSEFDDKLFEKFIEGAAAHG